MQDRVSFGRRKIVQVNHNRCVSLPKIMLENMQIDKNDFLEFILARDGTFRIIPIKGDICNK